MTDITEFQNQFNNIIEVQSNVDKTMTTYDVLFKKFGLYIILFIYILFIVGILRPKMLYKYDTNRKKNKFLIQKYIFTCIIIYLILLGIIKIWNHYMKNN
jgi:biotin transporter BioY